jgi:hypothetical protein
MGDFFVQPVGLRAASSVRLVYEPLSNHSRGTSLIWQVCAPIHGIQEDRSPLDMMLRKSADLCHE